MQKKQRKFTKVYFVVQIFPHFNVCGYCFNKKEAEEVAKYVTVVTGIAGRVISFTRKQIKQLDFGRSFAG